MTCPPVSIGKLDMTVLIEAIPPSTWQELEQKTAAILRECGYKAEAQKKVQLARGDVDIDVWAEDQGSPSNILAIECKHWATRATKNVVHGFRTVVSDSGANTGLIVSSAGYQKGAKDAAKYSNVQLLTWPSFQHMFADRWYRHHLGPTIEEEAEPLFAYTEPLLDRHIIEKADTLPDMRRKRFIELRSRHFIMAQVGYVMMDFRIPMNDPTPPKLPLRSHPDKRFPHTLPASIMDAPALRPFLDAWLAETRKAVSEFDEIFEGPAWRAV